MAPVTRSKGSKVTITDTPTGVIKAPKRKVKSRLTPRPAPRSAPRSTPRSKPRSAPRSKPRSAPRSARQDNGYTLRGHNVKRTTISALDKECGDKFGSEFKFVGANGVNLCSDDTALVANDRKKLTRVMEEASESASALRSQLKLAQKEYASLSTVLRVYGEEFPQEKRDMQERSQALSRFVSACGKLAGAILQTVTYCVQDAGSEKLERRCFDADYIERAVDMTNDALQVVERMRRVMEQSLRKFKLGAATWFARRGRDLVAAGQGFVDATSSILKKTFRLAAKHFIHMAIAAGIYTAMGAFVGPWILNVTQTGTAINTVCSTVEFAFSAMENTLLLSAVLSTVLAFKLQPVEKVIGIVRGAIFSKFPQSETALNAFGTAYQSSVNTLRGGNQELTADDLRKVGMDVSDTVILVEDNVKENQQVTRGSAGIALYALLSCLPACQWGAWILKKVMGTVCSGVQGLTHFIGANGTYMTNFIFNTKYEYWGKFLTPNLAKEFAVLLVSDMLADKHIDSVLEGINEKIKLGNNTPLHFYFMKSINMEDAAARLTAIQTELQKNSYLSKKRQAQLHLEKELGEQLRSAVKRNRTQLRAAVKVVLMAAVIIVVIMGMTAIIMARKQNTLEDFLGVLEEVNLADPDASETLFKERLPVLRTRVAALEKCMLGSTTKECKNA